MRLTLRAYKAAGFVCGVLSTAWLGGWAIVVLAVWFAFDVYDERLTRTFGGDR